MAQQLIKKAKGIYTSANKLSAVPEGALTMANNVVIDREDVIEPRRGFDRLSAAFATAGHRALQLWFYQDTLFAWTSADEIQYWNGSAWTALSGTYAKPTSAIRPRTAEANQNLFFTASTGIHKQDAYSATPTKAGCPKGLDITASLPGSPTAAWLADDGRVTYRAVWGIKDANGNVIRGAPSARETVLNTAGADRDVSIRVTIPTGITTAHFVQLYRSAAISDSGGTLENNDELGLVYETNPSSGDISAGYLDILDIVPDALRGETIYTASSQQGLALGNEQPPLARDIAVFKGHMFYGDLTERQRFYLTLLSVSGTAGIVNDDTIAVGGQTYTGKASETIASREFAVVTGGSAGQNIRDTAVSLCRVINRDASCTVYAYYLSGQNDLPGKILLEERTLGGATFPVVSSKSTCWNPALPSSGTSQSSTADSDPAGLAWSKEGEHEAVPLPYRQRAGSKTERLRRVMALRDSVFLLKDDGVYRVTGDSADTFAIEPFDTSTRILAPESAVVLANQIYALTDQGVVAISDTGVSVVSLNIEDDLLALFGASLAGVEAYTFGVAYESARRYLLWTISSSSDTWATQAWTYNTYTATWTRWPIEKRCGIVSPVDDKLYLGESASAYVNKERKAYDYTDYVDFGFATTITAISVDEQTVTLGSLIDDVAVGDIIYQTDAVFGIVTAVDTIAATATVSAAAEWTIAAATVLKAIDAAVVWAPVTMGNPGALKQFNTAIFLFETDFIGTATVSFESDLDRNTDEVELQGSSIGNWGLFGWGEVPWGGEDAARSRRTYVPRTKQLASRLTVGFAHRVAYSGWELVGLSLYGEPAGDRVTR